jgi:hypothetical protein
MRSDNIQVACANAAATALTTVSQVRIHNDSPQDVFARLYIDGQLVAQRLRRAHTTGTISSIPVNCKEQKELQFSLPRFPTVAEQAAGGNSLDPNKLSDLGTIRYTL